MKTLDEQPANAPQRSGFFTAYRQLYPVVLHHPAAWLLTLLWLLATMYLLAVGKATLLNFLATGLSLVFVLLTLPLTQGAPPATWETPGPVSSRWRLWLQCGLTILGILLVVLLTFLATVQWPLPWLISLYTAFRSSILLRFGLVLIAEITSRSLLCSCLEHGGAK